MSRTLYITRTADWIDSERKPITPDEWQAVVAESQFVPAATMRVTGPKNQQLRNMLFARWTDPVGGDDAVFRYEQGRITVTNPSVAVVAKMKVIAGTLKARVVDSNGCPIP